MENEADKSDDMGQPIEHPPAQAPPKQTKSPPGKRKKMMLMALGAAVVVLVLAAAGYMLFLKKDTKKPTNQTTTQKQKPADTKPAAPADSTPVTYKNAKLNIELTHRKDWTLKEASGGSEIVLTSPRVSYATSDEASTTGVFTLKIRKGVTDAMKATLEAAVASRDSEVIGYTAPTEQQRYYTNVSYGGKKDSFNFFIVTGNTAFKSGQAFAYSLPFDNDSFVIVGGYGPDSSNSFSFESIPKRAIDSEVLTQALDIVKSLKIF